MAKIHPERICPDPRVSQSTSAVDLEIKVLHITNLFPVPENAQFGIFIKEQLHALSQHISCDVMVFPAMFRGMREYVRLLFEVTPSRLSEYDIVHCHHAYIGLLYGLRFRRKPFVLSILGGDYYGSLFQRMIATMAMSLADAVVFKAALPKGLAGNNKVHYVPNGVNTDFFSPVDRTEAKRACGLNPDRQYISFVEAVSSFRPEKRHDIAEKVVGILKERGKDVELLHISGIDSREQYRLLLNASDVNLLVSDYEGSPNSVKEALALNIPVVARNVGNVGEMIGGLEGCYVVDSVDPAVIATFVDQALSVQVVPGRQRLSELALDIDSTTREILDIYEKVLRSGDK